MKKTGYVKKADRKHYTLRLEEDVADKLKKFTEEKGFKSIQEYLERRIKKTLRKHGFKIDGY